VGSTANSINLQGEEKLFLERTLSDDGGWLNLLRVALGRQKNLRLGSSSFFLVKSGNNSL